MLEIIVKKLSESKVIKQRENILNTLCKETIHKFVANPLTIIDFNNSNTII